MATRKRVSTTFKSNNFDKALRGKSQKAFMRVATGMARQAAFSAIDTSPVWSGAYVKSFSIIANSRSKRGRSFASPSIWRNTRLSSTEALGVRARSRQQVNNDLQGIRHSYSGTEGGLESLTVRNDAPHATLVRNSSGIFSTARRTGLRR